MLQQSCNYTSHIINTLLRHGNILVRQLHTFYEIAAAPIEKQKLFFIFIFIFHEWTSVEACCLLPCKQKEIEGEGVKDLVI